MLREAMRQDGQAIRFWPFDGPLDDLLDGSKSLVAAETYPREYYRHVSPVGKVATRWSKRRQADRLSRVPSLREWACALGVRWDARVLDRVEDGFGTQASGEDEFDAVIGLLAMVAVVTGKLQSGEPADDHGVSEVDGWILGRHCELDGSLPD
jgi:hypothetical protein